MDVCTATSSSPEMKGPAPYVPSQARVRSSASSSVSSDDSAGTLVESDGPIHSAKVECQIKKPRDELKQGFLNPDYFAAI